MKIQENPPRPDHEEVESFKGDSPESITEEVVKNLEKDIAERAYEEGRKIKPEEQEKVEDLRAQIAYETSVNRKIQEKTASLPKGDEPWMFPKTQNISTKPWYKRAAIATLFTLGSLFGSAKDSEKKAEADVVKQPTTESVAKNTPSDSTKNNVEVYTKAKTEKGGITPTGLSNSFLENEYDVTPGDIDSLANEYGFSTRDEASFQKDLIEHAQKNDPEIIQYVLKHFGQTEYGLKNNMAPTDYKQLIDGFLGVRAAYIMKFYKDKEDPTEPDNNNEVAPYSEFAQDGETMFTPGAGSRAIGELCYPTRKTDDVTKSGNLETSKVAAILRIKDDFGFTGEVVELTTQEIQDFFGATKHAKDGDVLAKIKEKAKMVASK